jgi:hypothetical protein
VVLKPRTALTLEASAADVRIVSQRAERAPRILRFEVKKYAGLALRART